MIELIKLNGDRIRKEFNFPKLDSERLLDKIIYSHIEYKNIENNYHFYISDSLAYQGGYYPIEFIYNDMIRYIKNSNIYNNIYIISEILRIDSENLYLLYSNSESDGYIGNDLIFLYLYRLYTIYTQYGILFNKPILISSRIESNGSLNVLISIIERNYSYIKNWLRTIPYNIGKDWNNYSSIDIERLDVLHNMLRLSRKYTSPTLHVSTPYILFRQEQNNILYSEEKCNTHYDNLKYFSKTGEVQYNSDTIDWNILNRYWNTIPCCYNILELDGKEYHIPIDFPYFRKMFIQAYNIIQNKNKEYRNRIAYGVY